MSKIEWTEKTWNPIVGCSVVSPGCTNCYAMGMAARLERMGLDRYVGLTKPSKAGPVWTGKTRLVEDTLTEPLRRRKPTMWFVNSMSDLFHESVPDAWIDRVFAVMALAPQHTFQVLTKRSARMRAYMAGCEMPPDDLPLSKAWVTQWHRRDGVAAAMGEIGKAFPVRLGKVRRLPLPNVWLGVSAEDQRRADERIPDLLATPAAVRFVSAEPLLGQILFKELRNDEISGERWDALTGSRAVEDPGDSNSAGGLTYQQTARLDWIIVGGESGPGARPMETEWAQDIRDQCIAAEIPYFFKQHGDWIGIDQLRHLEGWTGGPGFGRFDHCRYDQGAECLRVGKRAAGRLLDGVKHDAMPPASAVPTAGRA